MTSDVSFALECHKKNAKPPPSTDDPLGGNFVLARSPQDLSVSTQHSLRSAIKDHDSFRSEALLVFVFLEKVLLLAYNRFSTNRKSRKQQVLNTCSDKEGREGQGLFLMLF